MSPRCAGRCSAWSTLGRCSASLRARATSPAALVVVAGGRLLGIAVDEVTDVVAVASVGDGGTVDVDGRLHQVLHPDRLTNRTDEEDA